MLEDDPRVSGILKMVPKAEWERKLLCKAGTQGARVLARLENIVLHLSNLNEYKGNLKFNSFSSIEEFNGNPITDNDVTSITCHLERFFDQAINVGMVRHGLSLVANKNPYNPLLDYLNSLVWDGVERVPTLFIDHFGTDDSDYCLDVARSFMVSAVARAFVPGCKVDTMLILEGLQGIFKSTFIEELVGKGWYAEITADIESPKIYLNMRGKWVMDFGELSVFAKKDAEDIKRFITRISDTYTPPYGRSSVTVDRNCIFFGSTNKDLYFKDETGNRRFLPIKCEKSADIDRLRRERDQLWAEAVHLYKGGWKWWQVRFAEYEQGKRMDNDAWLPLLREYIEQNETKFSAFPHLLTPDAFVFEFLKIESSRYDNIVKNRVRNCFRQLGYQWTQCRSGDLRGVRFYAKIG